MNVHGKKPPPGNRVSDRGYRPRTPEWDQLLEMVAYMRQAQHRYQTFGGDDRRAEARRLEAIVDDQVRSLADSQDRKVPE